MAAIIPIIGAVASGLGVVGSVVQGVQGQKAAARTAEYNARVSEQNAKIAREQAARNEAAQRREAGQVLGRQRASLAQGGILGSETARGVMEQSENLAELDALNIRYDGELRAQGLLADANASRMKAQDAYSNSKSLIIGGGFDLAKAGANTYDVYNEYKNRKKEN